MENTCPNTERFSAENLEVFFLPHSKINNFIKKLENILLHSNQFLMITYCYV